MKLAKRILAVIMMAALAMALTIPAFAANNDGKITITNAKVGETYKIYKVFDLTYSGEENNKNISYTYTKSGDTDSFFDVLNSENSPFTLTPTSTTGIYNVALKEGKKKEDVISFLKENENNLQKVGNGETAEAPANDPNATATSVEFTNLAYGYYYITSTTGTLVTIDSAAKEVNVQEKNDEPTVEKKVKNNTANETEANDSTTASIGDTVEFSITIHAKPGAKNYVLHDTMTSGLTFNANSVQVTAGNQTLTAITDQNTSGVYEVKTTGLGETNPCTFHIEFTETYLNTIDKETNIVVTYTATVNENAVTADPVNNKTHLDYGNESKTTEVTATVYTYDFSVFKYVAGEEGSKTSLAGAKFTLSKDENSSALIAFHKKAGVEEYTLCAENGCNNPNHTTEITTSTEGTANGQFKLQGLAAGTYYLTETEAPNGYNKLTGPIKVVIAQGTDDKNNCTVTYYNSGSTEGTAADRGTISVENKSGTALPSTGGIGTTIFYVAGGFLAVGAVVLMVVKKRMSAE